MKQYSNIFMIGIGGIGMSALARFFNAKGYCVFGFDKTKSDLTICLEEEGMHLFYDYSPKEINQKLVTKQNTLVVYTAAIRKDDKWLIFFLEKGYRCIKRAKALGLACVNSINLAVAGTHGKTTTSSILAHIIADNNYSTLAFLGGIANNFNSNYYFNINSNTVLYSVVEADEFDRSFLELKPNHAIITSMDADHLDIYGKTENLYQSFNEFAGLIDKNGVIVVHCDFVNSLTSLCPNVLTYGIENGDFRAEHVHVLEGKMVFDLYTKDDVWRNMVINLAGKHNVENAVAALALAHQIGIGEDQLRKSLASYKGVCRRFDKIIEKKSIYIDDYAHHPTELNAAIGAARMMYPEKKITGIFQPHLFTRTANFMHDFAAELSKLDECILLDIYPAREEPIGGITSQVLLDLLKINKKQLLSKKDCIAYIKKSKPELLMTLGAGDIEHLVVPLKEIMSHE